MKINIPRIAQPLFRRADSILLIGLIKSVDTVPVANRDVFRVVVRNIETRKTLRFDLSQDNWDGKQWVVAADTTGEIQ
jgi:hypothetical protein